MADALGDGRRRGTGKRAAAPLADATAGSGPTPAAPCGACKFLRRKCISGCIFAPHFGSDQGAARFAAVHKVFGASNVSKLLLHIPVNRRHDAVVTISYEAQARLSDPVYGCVSTILALQQQVASLQAELAMVQSQLMGGRLAAANAYNNLHQQQMHPAYSNNSAASNNNNLTMSMSVGLIHNNNNMSSGATTFNSNLELTSAETFPSLQLSRHPHSHDDDEDDQDSPTHSLPFPLHAL